MLPEMKLPEGPWLHEPDFARWRDPETGLQCAIIRSDTTGVLCGYVRVPRGKLHSKLSKYPARHKPRFFEFGGVKRKVKNCSYNHGLLKTIEVHGGLTFAGSIYYRKKFDGYWIGFDCGHAWDFMPGVHELLCSLKKISNENILAFERDSVYRDFAYVKAEITSLARQVAEINRKF